MNHWGREMRLILLVAFMFLICSPLAVLGQSAADTFVGRSEIDAGEFKISEHDWPWWRGAMRDGSVADAKQAPTDWSETKNVAWKAPVVGRGHGSPTVLGQRVFLASADPARQVQVVLCWDRATGKQLWEATVHEGGFENKSERGANQKASLASSTIATDGERLYINFLNHDAVYTTALNLQGELVWQQKICDYVLHQGYGSSPAVYQDLVIVSADNKGGGAIAGLDRESGEVRWLRGRPAKPNYASPSIMHLDGKDQLIFSGCDLVTSLNPKTGEVYWEIEGSTTECVTTSVTDGVHIFTSGGYPKNHLAAVRVDGSGKIDWERNTRVYVPSMLQRGGYLYATLDAGVASCFRCEDGEELWKARLGGTFTSSPVLHGDRIYATNEEGVTFIFLASPEGFEKLAENQLGNSVYATPAICGGQIFMRVGMQEDDQRQEWLYCIAE